MRHTLLPPQEQKSLKREYCTRLAIVACCIVSTALIVGSILLLPGYLRARGEEEIQLEAIAELRNNNERKNDSAIIDELAFNSTAISLLESALLQERPSDVIERVVSLREGVYLNSLSYSVTGTTTIEVVIQDTALTRAALLAFKTRLERLSVDSRINLPIDELAKSSDIPFSLKFVYKKP